MQTDLQAILDATMDVVAVFDSDRRFVSVNAAACRFYGHTREELVGRRLDDFIGTERAEADWKDFLTPERIAQGMLENVWDGEQDGRRLALEVRATPEFVPGRHLFVLRDITERRVLEDQLRQAQKMEAVGQLAGGIAHDFNNLLTVIAGYGEIARRRIGAGPGVNELGEIQRAAERAGELTRQLLAFARRQVLEPVPLDVNRVATGLAPMLSRLLGETIEIAMLAGDELPPVLADRVQLEQVVINLAINARDAMPGGGTLAIETSFSDGHVRLAVSDTGSGIEPELLERIFEPFYTTKEVGLGTGLGLATVHGIVTQSGGRVDVVSSPGMGSTFTVLLPAADAALEPVVEPRRAAAARRPRDPAAVRGRGRRAQAARARAARRGLHRAERRRAGGRARARRAPRRRRARDRHRDAGHVGARARRPARPAARAVHLGLLVRGGRRAAERQRVPGEAVRPRRAAGRRPCPARPAGA